MSLADLPPLPEDPTVSVVIPARNSARTLPMSVQSALAQQPRPHEIVIAIGPSDDSTWQVAMALAEHNDAVRVADNPGGATPAGLNAAIRLTEGDVVVRLDAHAALPPGYVRRALETLRETGAVNVGGRQVPVADRGFARAVAAAMASPVGAGGATYRTGRTARPVDTVYLGVFRRDALEAVGGFDERLLRNQDYELNHRLRAAGGVVWFDPELEVAYRPRDSVGALAAQYFAYGRWKRVTLRLHRRSLRLRQLAPPALLLTVVGAVLLGLVTGIWWPFGAAAGGYVAAVVLGAAVAAAEPRQIPATVLAFVVMHVSWGLGFLLGPPRDALRAPTVPPPDRPGDR